MPSFLSAHPSLSIPALDAFQLHLTPFDSTPTSLVWNDPETDSAATQLAAAGWDLSSPRARSSPPPAPRRRHRAAASSFADDLASATGDVPDDVEAATATRDANARSEALLAARAVDASRELPPDTIAPMPEWLYDRRLDIVPAVFGRLNPFSGVLVYYTGAVLGECGGAPLVALQWIAFVFAPALAATASLRCATCTNRAI